MITMTSERITADIEEYLSLAESVKRVKERQDEIKARLEREMEHREVFTITTTAGEAKIITRSASVSFPSIHVLNLAETWMGSTDPIFRQCGELLLRQKQEHAESTYVRISALR